MRTLHRQSEEFDDRNLFLQVLLGLVAVTRGVEDVVAEWADGGRTGLPPNSARASDPTELLLLGLVAVSRRFHEHVRRAADAGSAAAVAASTPSPRAAAPDALRRLLV